MKLQFLRCAIVLVSCNKVKIYVGLEICFLNKQIHFWQMQRWIIYNFASFVCKFVICSQLLLQIVLFFMRSILFQQKKTMAELSHHNIFVKRKTFARRNF